MCQVFLIKDTPNELFLISKISQGLLCGFAFFFSLYLFVFYALSISFVYVIWLLTWISSSLKYRWIKMLMARDNTVPVHSRQVFHKSHYLGIHSPSSFQYPHLALCSQGLQFFQRRELLPTACGDQWCGFHICFSS